MAFGLGSILGAVTGAAAPIIGAALGGPVGAAIGAVGTAVGTAIAQPTPVSSQVGPGAATQVRGARVPMAMATRGRGLITELLGIASEQIGRRITASQVLALVRDLGLAAAALALGLTETQTAQVIAARPRRRRRGITAASIATTRRTIRQVSSIQRQLAEFCPPPRRRAPTKRITATRVQA